ncbi:hypothetical protein [Microbaculum marinum]|uniref:hypothetical protein n=1 Tax=Microbaculum marinum TaxID=1764581 RepID=UPI0030EC2863
MAKPEQQIRAAFVSEIAFARLCGRQRRAPPNTSPLDSIEEAKAKLLPILENPTVLEGEISDVELNQINGLEKRLVSFFRPEIVENIVRPIFSGCGYIDSSEGDIINDGRLFEIKAVDRPFRSSDIRQLITYCALNHLSNQYDIKRIGVFNPRRGVYFSLPVRVVSREISGQTEQELFDNIVNAVSSGDISR